MSEKEREGAADMPGLTIRYTREDDGELLKKWLLEPGVLKGFPMINEQEVEDSVKHWIGFYKYKCSLTAEMNGVPCGLATLNLMPYKKLAHQCLISIIVGEAFRNKGIGTFLMNNLLHLAKKYFHLEVLYLEVY